MAKPFLDWIGQGCVTLYKEREKWITTYGFHVSHSAYPWRSHHGGEEAKERGQRRLARPGQPWGIYDQGPVDLPYLSGKEPNATL